jgi:hypothetical protein
VNDLILRTKVEILQQNLAQVKQFVDDVKNRQRGLSRLSDLLGQDIPSQVDTAFEAIDQSKSVLRRSNQREAIQQLEVAEEKIDTIQVMLKQAMEILMDLQARYVEIDEALDDTLRRELGIKAKSTSSKLVEIHRIRKEAESKNDQSEANDLLQKSWKLYNDQIIQDSQLIFEEYVDFLGGLTLRDAFVDLGICQIADDLIAKWEKDAVTAWGSLTIPAHRETMEVSAARIIRLGFPEWTIWGLPLTARGFGDVVIAEREELKQYIIDHSADEKARIHLHNFLADAFATYAMGPAYVYAAILLRFDPRSAYDDKRDEPPGAKRAYVMFTMLEQMKEAALETAFVDPYSDIIKKVREEWEAALLQVKASGSLPATEEEQLKQWVTYFFKYLKSNTYDEALYSRELWSRIEDLSKELLRDDIDAIDLDKYELRDVLNAAWACRVNQKDDTAAIAKAAGKLCERIYARNRELELEKKRKTNRGGGLDSRSSRQGRG